MSERIISLILLVLVIYAIGRFVKWFFRKLAGLAAWTGFLFFGGPCPKTAPAGRARSYYAAPEKPYSSISYGELYQKLDAWNEDDEECGPDDHDYLGDDLYEEITARAHRITGRRPDPNDPVPAWVAEEYAEWL